MSETADQESKTEEPSHKRLTDAIEKGNTPFSREVVTAASLLAALGGLAMLANTSAQRLLMVVQVGFDGLEQKPLRNGADAALVVGHELANAFFAIMPIVALLAVGGIMGALGQNVPSASLDRIMPDFQRISPRANFQRIFGMKALGEFAKTTTKVLVVAALLYHVFQPDFVSIVNSFAVGPQDLVLRLRQHASAVLAPVAIFAFLVAVADAIWSRMRWVKSLRMTREELKEEFKQTEGDPRLKARIKSLGQARARKRMMNQLPKATMVVVNPTHYAVAMRYVANETEAPMVIAKGMDSLALKIRTYCEENGIEVIENKELARALHKACEVDTMIPQEFYKVVAEIIHFIEVRKRLRLRPRLQG